MMGWRKLMGKNEKVDPLARNPKNPKNLSEEGDSSVFRVNSLGAKKTKTSFPVAVKMESSVFGATVDVELWPDRAKVAGCDYSNTEMRDLIRRGLSHEQLLAIHEVKQIFEGHALTREEDKKWGGDEYGCGNRTRPTSYKFASGTGG